MARLKHMLLGAAGAVLLSGCAVSFAQDADIVSAGSADVDADGQDAYRWIDRARALWDTVGDAPPDYSFAFDGGTPVAWELRDGTWVAVEEQPEGARTYFFAPGERGPFLVRETDRSFGYQDGNVAAVYDGGGRLLPRDEGMGELRAGEQLYERGRRLRDALLDRQWAPVDTTSWGNLNLFFIGIDPGWDSGWRYRNDGFARAEQRRWAEERARRAAMANAYARWRSGGFQGPPPPGLGHQWQHRPPQPGRPNAGQPGRPWMWGGVPGQRPNRPRPDGTRPTPGTVFPGPTMNTPGQLPVGGAPGRHDWEAGGPVRPRPDGAAARPPRGAGDGRPGWQGPRPDGAAARPPRGDGDGRPGWQGPRPGWQGTRPDGAGNRPGAGTGQPAPPPVAAPQPPAGGGEAGPRRGGWMSPGWARPPRPDGGAAPSRPSAPPPQSAARPAAAPAPAPVARPEPAPQPRPLPPSVRARHELRGD